MSYFNSPARTLGKLVYQLFKQYTQFQFPHTIQNSILKNWHITSKRSKLVVFDISSILSNIPIKECLVIVREILARFRYCGIVELAGNLIINTR